VDSQYPRKRGPSGDPLSGLPSPYPSPLWTSLQLDHRTALTPSSMDIWTSLQLDHMPTLPVALLL